MAILNIQRKFEYEYQILEVETQEGGCCETILKAGMSLEEAILGLEKLPVRDNCANYIILIYSEKK